MNFYEVRNAWSRVIKKRKSRRSLTEIYCPIFSENVMVENTEEGGLRCLNEGCFETKGNEVVKPLVVRGDGISVNGGYTAISCDSRQHKKKRKPIRVKEFEENGRTIIEETYATFGGFEIFARRGNSDN